MKAFGFNLKHRGYNKGVCVCTNYYNTFSRGGFVQTVTELENVRKMQDTASQTWASVSSDTIVDVALGNTL